MTYAYICPTCLHPQSRHLLIGPTIDGPYRCHYGGDGRCDCEIMQRGPSIRLTRDEFYRRFPDWPAES